MADVRFDWPCAVEMEVLLELEVHIKGQVGLGRPIWREKAVPRRPGRPGRSGDQARHPGRPGAQAGQAPRQVRLKVRLRSAGFSGS